MLPGITPAPTYLILKLRDKDHIFYVAKILNA